MRACLPCIHAEKPSASIKVAEYEEENQPSASEASAKHDLMEKTVTMNWFQPVLSSVFRFKKPNSHSCCLCRYNIRTWRATSSCNQLNLISAYLDTFLWADLSFFGKKFSPTIALQSTNHRRHPPVRPWN